MKNQKRISTLTGIIIIIVAIMLFCGVFLYEYYSEQNFINISQNQVLLSLSGLNFVLPNDWQIKLKNNHIATVVNSNNNQIDISVEAVNNYQDFGSGKYNLTNIKYGQAWDEVATENIIPIGISFNNGRHYDFLADFGNHKVSTNDYNQIWNIVKNASPIEK
ncbi:MAG: hypothetical protein HYS02_02105 [Candidatus Staskawiczbacteria bacterium]|nr:hypothetical protein [Candidatus Staskawiczbacteria bacterium]